MVGFPGETEKRFRRLFDLVKEAHFEHLGVFRYSKEEGTAAATLKGHVSARVKEQRYHQIMRLQRQISLRRQKEKVGTRIPVLIERPGKSSGLLWEGRTQGQAPEVDGVTFLRRGRARPGEIVEAVITEATAYDFYGDIIGPV
jgi:ribosomal protein S12 methylthiotransferase